MENYNKYQSQEWVDIQNEIEEDENSPSIMDEFKKEKNNKFIWTDELVKQYSNYLFAFGTSDEEKMRKFKQEISKNNN